MRDTLATVPRRTFHSWFRGCRAIAGGAIALSLLAGCSDEDETVRVSLVASSTTLGGQGPSSSTLQVTVLRGDSYAPLGTTVTILCINAAGEPGGRLEGSPDPVGNVIRVQTDQNGSALATLTCGTVGADGDALLCTATALGERGRSPQITCLGAAE